MEYFAKAICFLSLDNKKNKFHHKPGYCVRLSLTKFFHHLLKILLLLSLSSTGAYAIDDGITDYKTIPAGSLVIDMGVIPQTVGNALRPYGYLTTLFANNIPVEWVIKPGKAKDGVDFSVDGKSFSGGPFVVTAGFAPLAQSLLVSWPTVVTYTTLSDASNVPVYDTLRLTPFTRLDADNGDISESYLAAAGVPSSFYGFKDPQVLDSCDDFYTMPHADPEWGTHNNLVSWNQEGGYIWAA